MRSAGEFLMDFLFFLGGGGWGGEVNFFLLFIMLCKVVLTFESVDEILKREAAVLSGVHIGISPGLFCRLGQATNV